MIFVFWNMFSHHYIYEKLECVIIVEAYLVRKIGRCLTETTAHESLIDVMLGNVSD